jgi:hypothetical protein
VNGFSRTLFNHIHRKNDPDNCLSQNFIPNIITQDAVIPQLKFNINVFTSSTYMKNVSSGNVISVASFKVIETLQSWHS